MTDLSQEAVERVARQIDDCDDGCIRTDEEGRLASHSIAHLERRDAACLLRALRAEITRLETWASDSHVTELEAQLTEWKTSYRKCQDALVAKADRLFEVERERDEALRRIPTTLGAASTEP